MSVTPPVSHVEMWPYLASAAAAFESHRPTGQPAPSDAPTPQQDMQPIFGTTFSYDYTPPAPFRVLANSTELTLLQIEAVLDDLNTNVDEMVLKGPGAAGGTSKDNMDVMKTFARPKTGLKGLVQMVEEVVADLDA